MSIEADYQYDVFVSYPRNGDVEPWVRKRLVPRLKRALQENLARDCLFIDAENLDTGIAWPEALARAHSRSKVLLAVFSRQYFKKSWCVAELESMLKRAEQCGLGTSEEPNVLVHAIVAHDCEDPSHIPEPYRHIQRSIFKNFVYDTDQTDWPFFRGFQDQITALADAIADTVERAPPWRPDFPVLRPNPVTAEIGRVPRF